MNVELSELVARTKSLGVEVWMQDGELHCRAAKGVLNDTIKEELLAFKQKLLPLEKNGSSHSDQAQKLTHNLQQASLPFPLTDMQRAYWLGRGSAFSIGNIACHLYVELRVKQLDVGRFTQAWNSVIRRHDALRTTMDEHGMQQAKARVSYYSPSVYQGDERTVLENREALSHQVFDIARWPLFEIRISEQPNSASYVHMSFDAISMDGWSALLLFKELNYFYEHPESSLPDLAVWFRDYVVAIQAQHAGKKYDRSLMYWKKKACSLPSAPQLPLAKHPEEILRPNFARREAQISGAEWSALSASAEKHGLTATSLLLSAFSEVLAAWSKERRFTLNIPRFNRLPLHPDVNRMIGNFSSFTLLEVDFRGVAPFVEQSRKLQQQLLTDLDHDQVTGVTVLREMAVAQKLGSAAQMPVVFTSIPKLNNQGDDFSLLERLGIVSSMVSQTPGVWLDCHVYEKGNSLIIAWDAIDELFPGMLLDDMFGAFCDLIHGLAEQDSLWQASRLNLLPDRQKTLLNDVNATEQQTHELLLHQAFEVLVDERADSPAVITPERTLSYRSLNKLANALAHRLQEKGVQKSELVGVGILKGWQQIVAVLGILKSGAAYTPIDVSLPEERIRYLLDDAELRYLICSESSQTTFEFISGTAGDHTEVCTLEREIMNAGATNPEPRQNLEDLAYVIYTSGSTGKPKGVKISHRSAFNAINYANERCSVNSSSCVFGITALHHDLSVYDVFGPLMCGAALVLPEANKIRDPGHWYELIEKYNVSLWNSVPTSMEMLVEYVENSRLTLPPCLTQVILGGDWIPVTLPSRLRELNAKTNIHGIGGPTETTIWNIWNELAVVDTLAASIPYGKPITDNHYYIMDDELRTKPIWVEGQLCCSGAGLALGYWNDQAKTEERFTTHPETGQRLFKTGDMGRWLPSGDIEFLGRKDFQVKVRGLRIELGEIEACIASLAGVKRAVACVQGDRERARVVAFVVPHQSEGAAKPLEEDDSMRRAQFKMARHGLRKLTEKEVSIGLASDGEAPQALDTKLMQSRSTCRAFLSTPISIDSFSQLIGCLSASEQPNGLLKYLYPSSGGLYPVQCYLSIREGAVESLSGGLYYFHPQLKQLVCLSSTPQGERPFVDTIHYPHNKDVFNESAFSIYLVGKPSAIEPLYGEHAGSMMLLEAGCMLQLLMQVSEPLGLGICPVGDMYFEKTREPFGLSDQDMLLHSMCCGGADPSVSLGQTRTQSAAVTLQSLSKRITEALYRQLPEHMVPTIYEIDQLPSTANGKVDRPALLKLADGIQTHNTFIPPSSEIEEKISALWCETLEVSRLSVHENIFDLGANSLLAVKVFHQIQLALDKTFPMVAMFQYPTIFSLATFLQSEASAPQVSFDESTIRAEQRTGSRSAQARRRRNA